MKWRVFAFMAMFFLAAVPHAFGFTIVQTVNTPVNSGQLPANTSGNVQTLSVPATILAGVSVSNVVGATGNVDVVTGGFGITIPQGANGNAVVTITTTTTFATNPAAGNYTLTASLLGYFNFTGTSTDSPLVTLFTDTVSENVTSNQAVANGLGLSSAPVAYFSGSENGPPTATSSAITTLPTNAQAATNTSASFAYNGTTTVTMTQVIQIDYSQVGPSDQIWFGLPGGGSMDPVSAVPEPASLTLLGIGVVSMIGYGYRRRKLATV